MAKNKVKRNGLYHGCRWHCERMGRSWYVKSDWGSECSYIALDRKFKDKTRAQWDAYWEKIKEEKRKGVEVRKQYIEKIRQERKEHNEKIKQKVKAEKQKFVTSLPAAMKEALTRVVFDPKKRIYIYRSAKDCIYKVGEGFSHMRACENYNRHPNWVMRVTVKHLKEFNDRKDEKIFLQDILRGVDVKARAKEKLEVLNKKEW